MPDPDPTAPEPRHDPDKTTKAELAAEAKALGVPATGTKAEIADALDDAAATGRPPLAQVGQDALADEEQRTTYVKVDPDRPDHLTED